MTRKPESETARGELRAPSPVTTDEGTPEMALHTQPIMNGHYMPNDGETPEARRMFPAWVNSPNFRLAIMIASMAGLAWLIPVSRWQFTVYQEKADARVTTLEKRADRMDTSTARLESKLDNVADTANKILLQMSSPEEKTAFPGAPAAQPPRRFVKPRKAPKKRAFLANPFHRQP